jgi:uncharacterized protein (TIGR02118 family)
MIKCSVLIKRKPGMSLAQFNRYWQEKHGPLALSVKDFICHIRKYVQSHRLPDNLARGMQSHAVSQYDGIVELWADSADELKQAFASPGYNNVIRPDESNFCDDADGVIIMMTEDVVLKGPKPRAARKARARRRTGKARGRAK